MKSDSTPHVTATQELLTFCVPPWLLEKRRKRTVFEISFSDSALDAWELLTQNKTIRQQKDEWQTTDRPMEEISQTN